MFPSTWNHFIQKLCSPSGPGYFQFGNGRTTRLTDVCLTVARSCNLPSPYTLGMADRHRPDAAPKSTHGVIIRQARASHTLVRSFPSPINPPFISLECAIQSVSFHPLLIPTNTVCPCIHFLLQEVDALRDTGNIVTGTNIRPRKRPPHKAHHSRSSIALPEAN